jgi:trehalose 6-phosphate phosphatase
MEPISSLNTPPRLLCLAEGRPVALFLDFDGTLVAIAENPSAIAVPSDLAVRLEELESRLSGRLALVSGRSLDNLTHYLGPIALARAGSHGIERVGPDGVAFGPPAAAIPDRALEEISRFVAVNPALLLEAKKYGAALHFRSAPQLEKEVLEFARGIASDFDLEVKRGKAVVELVWPDADKGSAIRAFMQTPQFAGAVPIFIGDDITDEDGFRVARELGGLGIIVGDRVPTLARYRLGSPAELYRWLEL